MNKPTLIPVIISFLLYNTFIFAQTSCEGDTIAPVIVDMVSSSEPVVIGTEVMVTAQFTDQCGSPHTATWDWGEINYPTQSIVIEPNENTPGIVTGKYIYSFPGVYSVTLILTDHAGNISQSQFQYIVTYSTSEGFVTGGGWIQSPEGAYTPDPTLSGKANFGFVSKYKKGKTVPEGNTQFSFKVADLHFKSTSYDWLVIAGPQAKFKGSGTINGTGDYGFMLTARDGQVNGGGGVDRFRIKIWMKDQYETIIYDNQLGDSDDADATDGIEGGSIVIHDTQFDVTPPVVIITLPFDGSFTNQTSVPVSWMIDGVVQTEQISEELIEGENQIIRTATDEAGNTGADTVTVILDITPPEVTITTPEDGLVTNQDSVIVTGSVSDATDVTLGINSIIVEIDEFGSFTHMVSLDEGENIITIMAVDAAGNITTICRTVTYMAEDLPPDPSKVAPPLDPTVIKTMCHATQFLYTGSNPIQTDMDSSTIELKRAAVIRGNITSGSGDPISGVTISILNHPEYGQTLSRIDGWFDMAVNGGDYLTIYYKKEDYLPVQRKVYVPWRDYVTLDSVVMIGFDPNVTLIDFSNPIQVARGSVETDEDGTRQATLLFKQGTVAEMIMPDSTTQVLDSLHVRATEYTVGPAGPAAMPAGLPSNVGYTYCVELSADEMIAAGASQVQFSQPVSFYLDNFLDFPDGSPIPVGYYNREIGQWIPCENGWIIRIITIQNGMAELDIDGDGISDPSDSLSAIGITENEQQQLALLYDSGQSLWRIQTNHFSAVDFNWPVKPPDDELPPDQKDPIDKKEDKSCEAQGSKIGIQNQTLGESINITGTEIQLNYISSRVPGEKTAVDVLLSEGIISPELEKIILKINVAGKSFAEVFDPSPNLNYQFIWDHKDAFGRTVYGEQPISIEIGYQYNLYYMFPALRGYAFGQFGGSSILRRARSLSTLWKKQISYIGNVPPVLCGWNPTILHYYNPNSRVIHFGNGTRRSAYKEDFTIHTLIDSDVMNDPWSNDMTSGPDGSIYISTLYYVYKFAPDSTLTVLAGTGSMGYNGDGIPANQASLRWPMGLTVGPDGSVYIVDSFNHRIRKVTPDGIIHTVAGCGTKGFSGDYGPATDARLYYPTDIALDPDGNLYITDGNNNRIRKVSPDGIIRTIAGTGEWDYSGDGGPAIDAKINYPWGIDIGPDGSVYFADTYNYAIRKIGPDGIINTIAGTGEKGIDGHGDGGPANEAKLYTPTSITVSPAGIIYFSDQYDHRIRVITTDGIINTCTGTGEYEGDNGDGGYARNAKVYPYGLAVHPNGSICFLDYSNYRNTIRILSPLYPEISSSDIRIASDNGNEIFIFSPEGKHLKTVDALTNLIIYEFKYDEDGLLSSIMDRDSLITSIERDTSGNPIAMVSPFNQRTTFTLDSCGYINSITNPADETIQFTYNDLGLMMSSTNARGFTSHYTYNNLGRLILTEDPAGGFKELSKVEFDNGYEIAPCAQQKVVLQRIVLKELPWMRANRLPLVLIFMILPTCWAV